MDLNNPDDARCYIESWVEKGALSLKTENAEHLDLKDGSDEECLRLAKQLFLYCDPHPELGTPGVRH